MFHVFLIFFFSSIGNKVKAKCLQEMFELRSELMQDYKISPELVSACEKEIKEYCDGGLELDGATIECLMENSMKMRNKEDAFRASCSAQVCSFPCSKCLNR